LKISTPLISHVYFTRVETQTPKGMLLFLAHPVHNYIHIKSWAIHAHDVHWLGHQKDVN